jgi:hypothetical protein
MMTREDEYLEKIKNRLTPKRQVNPDTGCWDFTGSITANGYGHISFRGKMEYTHRVAAILYLNFDRESDLIVMHRCDRPSCFNPAHLKIGTQTENMRDAAKKGRMGANKLTAEQAGEIKYLLGRGSTYLPLARQFGVSTTAIGQIARGDTWRDVEPRPPREASEGGAGHRGNGSVEQR